MIRKQEKALSQRSINIIGYETDRWRLFIDGNGCVIIEDNVNIEEFNLREINRTEAEELAGMLIMISAKWDE